MVQGSLYQEMDNHGVVISIVTKEVFSISLFDVYCVSGLSSGPFKYSTGDIVPTLFASRRQNWTKTAVRHTA